MGRHSSWASPALKIAAYELEWTRDALEEAVGKVEDALQQVEDADKHLAAVSAPHEVTYIQLGPNGATIIKWGREPFAGSRMCRIALPDVETATLTRAATVAQERGL